MCDVLESDTFEIQLLGVKSYDVDIALDTMNGEEFANLAKRG